MSRKATATSSTVGRVSAATARRTSDDLLWQLGKPRPDCLPEVRRDPQALSRSWPVLQPHQLAPQLQREERVPSGCLLHPTELRPGQVQVEALAEQMTKRPYAQRA